MTPTTTFRGSLDEKKLIERIRSAITLGRMPKDGMLRLINLLQTDRASQYGVMMIKMQLLTPEETVRAETPLLDQAAAAAEPPPNHVKKAAKIKKVVTGFTKKKK